MCTHRTKESTKTSICARGIKILSIAGEHKTTFAADQVVHLKQRVLIASMHIEQATEELDRDGKLNTMTKNKKTEHQYQ